jgi:hypothetical protein
MFLGFLTSQNYAKILVDFDKPMTETRLALKHQLKLIGLKYSALLKSAFSLMQIFIRGT